MSDDAVGVYRDLFDNSPAGYLTVDDAGIVTRANRTLAEWLGSDRLAGRSLVSLLPTSDQLLFETRVAPVLLLEGEVCEVSLTMALDGRTLPALVNVRRDAQTGELRIAVFDATLRQDYERELLAARRIAEASEVRVRILQAASAAFVGSHGEQQLSEELVENARAAVAASACAVMFVDATGAPTSTVGEHPLAELASNPEVAADIDALRTSGVVAVSSPDEARERFPLLADGLADARIEAFVVIPIEGRDGVTGALMCFFRRARRLEAEDLEMLGALARQAALALARIRLQEELVALALHDGLTGLANRRLLREHLLQGMMTATRRGRPIAILVVDLDDFKSINDAHGHQAGDAALKWVAEHVQDAVRVDDVVGRLGGDEFLIICHDADEDAAAEISARVREAISRHPDGLPSGAALTASIGAAVCAPEHADVRIEDFFAQADAALYASKRAGRDRVTVVSVSS